MTAPRAGAAVGALAIALFALYVLPIGQRGLVGPDEPRYASIAREMSESGDWVTPRLWGEAWFEKPAMLFWLGGLGHAAGIEDFTRVPVALLCLAFLAFFHWRLRRSFGRQTATLATLILGTAGGWVAYADAGVFDAPLTVFVSAALLCLLDWPRTGRGASLAERAAFGGLLGLAVLSKGLVAPVVAGAAALPAVVAKPGKARDLVSAVPLGAFCAVCVPWYAACYWENGSQFAREFIVRHHFERFASSSLQHVQPWWFYLPVIVAFLLPWTPLLATLRWESVVGGPRRRFLACWALGPLVFFSLAVNKLPAYVLPALPPLAILVALRWKQHPSRGLLAASSATLLLVPVAGAVLPDALADGILRAWARLDPAALAWGLAIGALLATLGAISAFRMPNSWSPAVVAATAAVALAALKIQAYPAISEQAGAAEFVAREDARLADSCIGEVRRHLAYGIRFYTADSVPACEDRWAGLRVEGDPPAIVANRDPSDGAGNRAP